MKRKKIDLEAWVLLAMSLTLLPGIAAADTFTGALDFVAPSQSIWGPGGGVADFGASDSIGSNSSVSLGYSVGASSGSVSGRFSGDLSADYLGRMSRLDAQSADIGVSFLGGATGGNLTTALGAFVDVTAHILNIPITVLDENYLLDINRTQTPVIDGPISGTDSVTVARAAFGPDIGVGSAQAGVDGDITQNASLVGNGITATLTATHRGSGTTRTAPVSLTTATPQMLMMDLGLEGFWDLQFTGISLDNLFSTQFLLDLVPFAEYTIGVGCGDPGTNSDNGILCVGDGRADFDLASVPLLSRNFALDFNTVSALDPFTIQVVPEPATLVLMTIGLVGFGLAVRRRG